ncbi:serine hydrolase [Streptococcus dentiloxodontae]
MKKVIVLICFIVSLSPLTIVSTEKDLVLTPDQTNKLTSNTIAKSETFAEIPKNPVTSKEVLTYKDANLTKAFKVIAADTSLKISKISLNSEGEKVFKLSNGSYLAADRSFIYDDQIYDQSQTEAAFWTAPDLTVYKSPYVKGTQKSSSKLTAYKKVKATKVATTHEGTYYYVDGQGWINQDYLETADNRMKAVQTLLDEKYNSANLSVYVKQIDTGKTAGINEDKEMYAASIAKLGVLYYTQQQILDGNLNLSDEVKYTADVHNFKGAYNPDGTGIISKDADNKSYSIENLLKAVSQHSDNVATNILGYYAADQYDKNFQTTVDTAADSEWDMDSKQLSAKTAGTLMEAIYHQDGDIIDYLSDTDYDDARISKNINVQVAHKIGDAYDYKHDVAIIYTDSPFILSIFTDKESYDKITSIADDIYEILK